LVRHFKTRVHLGTLRFLLLPEFDLSRVNTKHMAKSDLGMTDLKLMYI